MHSLKELSVKIVFSVLLLSIYNYSQTDLGTSKEIKESVLNSNAITTVVFNYGSIGKPNYLGNIADLVWKNMGYMFEFGPMIAARVVDKNGDSVNIISDSHILSGQGGYSPDGINKWGWLPRSGFANPSQPEIATAKNPSSWPANWNQWFGEFGDGQIIGRDEAFYVMDDFTNAEFPYYPFPDDTTKRGLGVKTEVRVYQFANGMQDALIIKYKITNESPKTLNDVYFGFMGDPHIGGFTDYSDDRINFIRNNSANPLPLRNTIYAWDEDLIGMGGRQPGYLSFKLLETPDNVGLTSFHPATYTNSLPNVPKNRPLMWQWFTNGIDSTNALLTNSDDNVLHFGTGPFTLKSGESKIVKLAIAFSDNYEDMENDVTYIYYRHNWHSLSSSINSEGGNPNYKINLTSPNGGIVQGLNPINWNYTGTDPNAQVFIDYSFDYGKTWQPVVFEQLVNTPYAWNTTTVNDGTNYLLRIVAFNPNDLSQYYYDVCDSKFTINNPVNGKPEIEILNPFDSLTINRSPFSISWTLEDADNDASIISLSYSNNNDGPFFPLIDAKQSMPGQYIYHWDFTNLPNSDSYFLKLTASDGKSDTTILTPKFAINQKVGKYPEDIFQHTNGIGTPELELQVIDPSQVTGNSYELTFDVDSLGKKLNIKNLTSNNFVLSGIPLDPLLTTPYFEGLKLKVIDKQTEIDFVNSKFNRGDLNSTFTVNLARIGNPIIKVPEDWIIVFNNLDTITTGQYQFPGDTVKTTNGKDVICPFTVTNYPYSNKANYLIYETPPATRNNGKWDLTELIILRPQIATGATTSYEVNFNFNSSFKPTQGDTLKIVTIKPITANDVFRFTADKDFILSVKDKLALSGFQLYQNYPNPFNPSTVISYRLAINSKVNLKIFDILGNEIATLVNEEQQAGMHNYELGIRNYELSSGVYFYQLRAGNFVETKKFILMK
ncbi:MAG: T9SS type A sorting domain-containing protein [Ignavibacteriaceae bacterium]|nr:T9SS type A sorting domain-containing protein [Ignavibacteriaceae bacterium]